MSEKVAEARLLDHIARDAIRLLGRHARSDELDRFLLGFVHDLIDLLHLRAGAPDDVRARHVAAIAFVARTPVEQQWLIARHRDLAGTIMRQSAVRTGRHDWWKARVRCAA